MNEPTSQPPKSECNCCGFLEEVNANDGKCDGCSRNCETSCWNRYAETEREEEAANV